MRRCFRSRAVAVLQPGALQQRAHRLSHLLQISIRVRDCERAHEKFCSGGRGQGQQDIAEPQRHTHDLNVFLNDCKGLLRRKLKNFVRSSGFRGADAGAEGKALLGLLHLGTGAQLIGLIGGFSPCHLYGNSLQQTGQLTADRWGHIVPNAHRLRVQPAQLPTERGFIVRCKGTGLVAAAMFQLYNVPVSVFVFSVGGSIRDLDVKPAVHGQPFPLPGNSVYLHHSASSRPICFTV